MAYQKAVSEVYRDAAPEEFDKALGLARTVREAIDVAYGFEAGDGQGAEVWTTLMAAADAQGYANAAASLSPEGVVDAEAFEGLKAGLSAIDGIAIRDEAYEQLMNAAETAVTYDDFVAREGPAAVSRALGIETHSRDLARVPGLA